MPDQDREPAFLHTLRQDPDDGAAARCPSCRGTGVTLQDECVCCGREVGLGQVPQTEDINNSIKDLRIKTEVDDAPQAVIIPAFVQERTPVIRVAAAGPRASNGRQSRRSNIPILRPGDGTRYASLGQLQQQNAGDNSRSSVRIYHQDVKGQPSSSSLTRRAARGSARGSARGGAGRGATGAHPTYRGVRTRRGVNGHMAEIRPPKWKKTIWLGTYNTSLEAARAYDAGVFYTKKSNTKYNFDFSEGTFPPLPANLRLDRPENMNAIKLFVQGQAKLAARRMGTTATSETTDSNLINQSSSSSSCLTGSGSTNSVSGSASADLHTASTEVGVEIDSEFEQLPLDLAFLEIDHCLQLHDENVAEEVASAMFDYTNYVSQQVDIDFQMLPEEEGDV